MTDPMKKQKKSTPPRVETVRALIESLTPMGVELIRGSGRIIIIAMILLTQ